MRSNSARIAIAAGAVALIVVLFVVLSGGDDGNEGDQAATTDTTTTATQTTTPADGQDKPKTPAVSVITLREGKPVGGVRKLTFTRGDQVRFRVKSDVADEIHVHGFDIEKSVPAGGSVTFSFPADIEGVFEVELHGRQEQIAQIAVAPA